MPLVDLAKDPAPGGSLLDTAPIVAPAPGTKVVATLQWNNLIDILFSGLLTDRVVLGALVTGADNKFLAMRAGALGYDNILVSDVPTLTRAKISDFLPITKADVENTGTWEIAEIPQLPALGSAPSPPRQTGIITAEIGDDQITYGKIQNVVGDDVFLGRISGPSGDIEELTATQATSLLNIFTAALKGLVPAPGAPTGRFLKDDITWAIPAGGSGTDEVLLVPTADKTIPVNSSIIVGDYYTLGSLVDLTILSGANLTVV